MGTLNHFSEKELRAWADTVAQRLNKILEENGFAIKFPEFDAGEFGVVSILDVMVEWLTKGDLRQVANEAGTIYPAVEFKDYGDIDHALTQLFSASVSPIHSFPIGTLKTKSGDTVSMTIAGEALSSFALMSRIDAIRTSELVPTNHEYLRFPMIDFKESKSLSWLAGLASVPQVGNPHVVAEALQETKFKMNQTGARLKDAVAMRMATTSVRNPRPRLFIDRPFFLWIERPGVPVPILYAYFDEEHWKDPGDLKNI
jgi:hypothetical protein